MWHLIFFKVSYNNDIISYLVSQMGVQVSSNKSLDIIKTLHYVSLYLLIKKLRLQERPLPANIGEMENSAF
jgi:hypothetical protein